MKPLAPICLFTYNRLWHTQQVIDALQKNGLAKQSELFIFSDGAKTEADQETILEVRLYLKSITGFKSITIKEQESNLGLANSIISGVTDILNQFDTVIVLEDDLVTSSKFLNYMNDALNKYADNENVASIHGYTYPLTPPMACNYFIYGSDCWGWATWKDQWGSFEHNGKTLLAQLTNENRLREFNFDNAYNYTGMLRRQISGKNNSWAIRWKASCLLKNKLSLYPSHSFVQNIGNDDSGTHSTTTDCYWHKSLNEQYSELDSINVEHSERGYRKMVKFYETSKKPIFQKVFEHIKKHLKALNA